MVTETEEQVIVHAIWQWVGGHQTDAVCKPMGNTIWHGTEELERVTCPDCRKILKDRKFLK